MLTRKWSLPAVAERIVINTGPLIALAQVDALDLLGKLPCQFICPPEVRAELDAGAAAGHAPIQPAGLHIVPLAQSVSVAHVALGAGEAAVIQLALEQGPATVCMDDWKGRRTALALGLNVTGTLGLLARAKMLGVIPAMKPVVQKLGESGNWYDPELVRRVLSAVGE